GLANGTGVPTSTAVPIFSLDSKTFSVATPQTLILSTDAPQGQIRYTTNGTVPTATSTLYTGPISITASTTVRARVYESGLQPGPVDSRLYEALDASVANFTSNLPIVVVDTFGKPL